jgi:hypothetical protein
MWKVIWDDLNWPLVTCQWHGETNDAGLDEYYVHIDRALAKKTPFAVVFDVSRGTAFGPKERKRTTRELEAREAPMKQNMIVGLVLGGQLQRGFVTALTWLSPPPFEQKVFVSVQEARAWCESRLAARRVESPQHAP